MWIFMYGKFSSNLSKRNQLGEIDDFDDFSSATIAQIVS